MNDEHDDDQRSSMMINDEHDDDHVMMMSCMTCTPIPCTMHGANAWYKGNTSHNAQLHKHAKNKRNVTKTCKNIQRHKPNNGVQKNHGNKTGRTKRGPHNGKGSLKPETHTTKQDGEHNETRRTPHKLCDGGHSPSPIRPRTPRRSAHPSLLVENPVDNSSNLNHNVTVVMWKTPQPVENPVENSLLVDNPVENPVENSTET